MKQHKQAEELYFKTYNLTKKFLGEHSETVEALVNLAFNSQELQKNNEAKSYADEALKLIDTLLKKNKDNSNKEEENRLEMLKGDCQRILQ